MDLDHRFRPKDIYMTIRSPIPDAALTRHIAILGSTGSGKTTAAKSGIVEPVLDNGGRVLVIDPTAAWWGLRLSASGKQLAFRIYIFGGDHGDYPLRAKDAAILAEVFAKSRDSAIFDTSHMTVGERSAFFIDFATTLLRRNNGPVNLVIDESHLFMPQAGAKVGGQVPAMLHAGNNLVSLGRSKGIRVTMISQRPAKLHKDSLTQAQALVAMRVLAPQDRKAIAEWIAEQADPEKGKEIIASLSSLKAGEAWVWAPLEGVLDRVKFRLPTTFDSSRAPDEMSGYAQVLPPINLADLKDKLSTIAEETKANDPKALKAEIARLKTIIPADPAAIDKAFQRGREEGYKEGRYDGHREGSHAQMRRVVEAIGNAAMLNGDIDALQAFKLPAIDFKPIPQNAPVRLARPPAPIGAQPGVRTSPNSAAIKMLAVLDTSPPVRRSWSQTATLAGLKARGGHFNSGRAILLKNGLVIEEGGLVRIAEPSHDAGPEIIDRDELIAMWASKLSGAAPRILQYLADHGPASRETVAEGLGMQPRGGHWNTSWSQLRNNGLVSFNGDQAELTELFNG
jgi:hypothetical protein